MTTAPILAELSKFIDCSRLLTDPSDCWGYSYDNSAFQCCPMAVVFPTSEQEVQTIVQLCNTTLTPITARGRGSGTTGAAVPTENSLVISFEKMDQIIKFDPDNRILIAKPGVTNQEIQTLAEQANLFWGPDPSSSAMSSLGGNLATNAAGPRAVKYGTTRDNTLGLTAILGNGQRIKTGVNTTKGVMGYDLTRLLIGSEGTLGLITEATLKLTPKAATWRTVCFYYRTLTSATAAIVALMRQPVTPCALEFMDHNSINLIRDNRALNIPNDTQALLIVEIDGQPYAIDNDLSHICATAHNPDLIHQTTAQNTQTQQAIWAARKALSPALRTIAPNKINEDVVVPLSEIPTLIAFLDALAKQHQIPIVNFGHAGNGNIHVNILANDQQLSAAQSCLTALFEKVIALGGTLSGEHGSGLAKYPFLKQELDAGAYHSMHLIKNALDPNHILNPGKI